MDYQQITLYISIGYFLGLMTWLIINKKNISIEKVVSLIVTTVWILLHVFGFILDKNVPFIFDAIGAGAVGSLAGLNVVSLLNNFRK